MQQINYPYREFENLESLPTEFILLDHAGGFDMHGNNTLLHALNKHAINVNQQYTVHCEYSLSENIKQKYSGLNINFDQTLADNLNYKFFLDYHVHPELQYKNFICSFNGTPHISRKLLTAGLNQFRWFNPLYSSKNFVYSSDELNGHIQDLVGTNERLYSKFFISNNSEKFFKTKYSFGHVQFDHEKNIYNLEQRLTQSFIHVVSETMATSAYPFVTEKFLYSVVTRGLFLSYAQLGWHDYVEKHLGFKKYNKIFDYRFDSIINPVERLVELLSMLSRFSNLTTEDWYDLYLMEQDTVEHNYNNYFSKNYLKYESSL